MNTKYFEDICKKNNLKITPQRTAVYNELANDLTHPETEKIFRKVRKIFPSISFDTVNRTLLSFVKIGLISTVDSLGHGKKYDPDVKPHHHLKCVVCGEIFDFYHEDYDELRIPGDLEKKYKIINKRVVLSIICESCQNDSN